MNRRTPTPSGSLPQAPPMPSSLKKFTQPPIGLALSLHPPICPPPNSIPPTDHCQLQTLRIFLMSCQTTPSLKQGGNRRCPTENLTLKITIKTMVHDNPYGRRNEEGTATNRTRSNADTPNTKNGGQRRL